MSHRDSADRCVEAHHEHRVPGEVGGPGRVQASGRFADQAQEESSEAYHENGAQRRAIVQVMHPAEDLAGDDNGSQGPQPFPNHRIAVTAHEEFFPQGGRHEHQQGPAGRT